MQIAIISGNLGKDAELKTTQAGDKVLSFSVGVQQGWGDRASTNWFRCSVWGKRAETLSGRLLKGVRVFATGEMTIGEYNGKPQFDLRVSELDFVARGDRQQEQRRETTDNRGGFGADLDDDVPF